MKLCGVCGLPTNAFWAAAVAAVAVFAAGCAPIVAPLQQEEPATVIKLTAVVVIRSAVAPARKAKIIWTRARQSGGIWRDSADIKTPFGTTHARLEIDESGMQIFVGGGLADLENAAPDVRLWLDGLPPPQSIGFWLAGESDPDYSTREIFAPQIAGIVRIQQHNWEAEYERDEAGFPARILLRPLSPLAELPEAEAEVRILRRAAE